MSAVARGDTVTKMKAWERTCTIHVLTNTPSIVYTRLMTVVIYSNIQLIGTAQPSVLSLFPDHSQILSCNHGYKINSESSLGIRLLLLIMTFPGSCDRRCETSFVLEIKALACQWSYDCMLQGGEIISREWTKLNVGATFEPRWWCAWKSNTKVYLCSLVYRSHE